jgi:ribosomal RNA assembly protein
MGEYSYELKIPKERVAVLIGKDGEVKTAIETETKTDIKVDSKEGDVFVSGDDALGLYAAREVIIAIGRGFNPELAMILLKQDCVFEVINLNTYNKSKEAQLRLKGRVIGKEGKSRKLIEELTEAYVSVYGKTICIIGMPESAYAAKHAIEMLLAGSTHSTVYKWLEKRRRDIKRREMLEL